LKLGVRGQSWIERQRALDHITKEDKRDMLPHYYSLTELKRFKDVDETPGRQAGSSLKSS
jgi:hypothetical protein